MGNVHYSMVLFWRLVWDHFELLAYDREASAVRYSLLMVAICMIARHVPMIIRRKTLRNSLVLPLSFNRGKIHYVVLDDVFFIGEAKKYIGYLPETQLQWLEQDLALVKPGTTVVVSLHIPTNTGAARRGKKEESISGVVSNRKQLYKILQPYKVHIMSGHTHYNEKWEEGNIMEHNHGTVCGAWWTGPICGDGTPNGYGVRVDGAEISGTISLPNILVNIKYVIRKGKSKDHPKKSANVELGSAVEDRMV